MHRGETKKQHYVPRFYLRRFTGDHDKLFVLDLRNRRFARRTGVSGVCQDKYFYGLRTGVSDVASQEVEAALGAIETRIGNRLPAIHESFLNGEPISPEDVNLLSRLISMLWLRGPAMRKDICETSSHVIKQAMTMVAKSGGVAALLAEESDGEPVGPETVVAVEKALREGTYSPNLDNSVHLAMLNEIEGFANLLAAQTWTILINETSLPFVTSDTPVIELIPPTEGFFGPAFSDCTHYFALSSQICMRLTPETTEGHLRQFEGATEALVSNLNLILARPIQYVYARAKEPLQQILDFHKLRWPLSTGNHEKRVDATPEEN